jgi:mannose-1-phosphate guanylyltransferase
MIKTAMILGAGAGRRLRPLTLMRPKPLVEVLNKTMLEWWAEFLVSAGVKRMVINVHYQTDAMLEHIHRLSLGFSGRLEILASLEKVILGTGGGIKQAAPLLGKGDFLVANADIFTDFELVKLALKHLANPGRLATLGLLDGREAANVSMGAGSRILGFRRPEPMGEEIARQTYCGVMALSPRIFDYLPEGESDIIEVFMRAISEGEDVFGWTYDPAIWSDMGTAASYWELNQSLAAGRTIVHSTAIVEGETRGWNVVGAEARLEKGASAENCVIWPSAVISEGAQVKNAIIAGLVPPGLKLENNIFCENPAEETA